MATQSSLPTIKILVCYHQPGHVFKNSVLRPIQLGCARAERDGGPGIIPGMLRDDTGDNISILNPKFCEITGLYWAWKNYAALGNPDYCGLMHYRRLLNFTSNFTSGVTHVDSPEKVRPELLKPPVIYSVVPQYDVCIKAPIQIAQQDEEGQIRNFNVWEQYIFAHGDTYLDQAFALAKRLDPDYTQDIDAYLHSTDHYLCNIMVMRRELFFEYCDWMFRILMPLERMIDYQGGASIRTISYISERLSGLYITRLKRLGRLKIRQIPSINIDCW